MGKGGLGGEDGGMARQGRYVCKHLSMQTCSQVMREFRIEEAPKYQFKILI